MNVVAEVPPSHTSCSLGNVCKGKVKQSKEKDREEQAKMANGTEDKKTH